MWLESALDTRAHDRVVAVGAVLFLIFFLTIFEIEKGIIEEDMCYCRPLAKSWLSR